MYHLDVDADRDPAFHFDADPDGSCLSLWCGSGSLPFSSMRIWIRIWILDYQFDSDPDPAYHIDADPDQHQFENDKPKCMEYEPIWILFQGFEFLFYKNKTYIEGDKSFVMLSAGGDGLWLWRGVPARQPRHLRHLPCQAPDDQLMHRHRQQPPSCGRDYAGRHVQPQGLVRLSSAIVDPLPQIRYVYVTTRLIFSLHFNKHSPH